MPAYGVAYDYLFKDHPQNLFGWVKLGAEGAQYLERLSGKALTLTQKIAKTAALFQTGYDIPLAFQSFRTLYEKLQGVEIVSSKDLPAKPVFPLWVDISKAVRNGAFVIDFTQHDMLDRPHSHLIQLVGAVADLISDGYDFYFFLCEWKKEPITSGKEQVSPIPEGEFKKSFINFPILSWDKKNIALLTKRVSSFVLTLLSFISVYRKLENPSPWFSIFCTTIYLSSDFFVYYQIKNNSSYKIILNYGS